MTNIIDLCERVILAQRKLDAVKMWMDNAPPDNKLDIILDWNWGSNDPGSGKTVLKHYIRSMVENQMFELSAKVVGQLEREAAEAIEALTFYIEKR